MLYPQPRLQLLFLFIERITFKFTFEDRDRSCLRLRPVCENLLIGGGIVTGVSNVLPGLLHKSARDRLQGKDSLLSTVLVTRKKQRGASES